MQLSSTSEYIVGGCWALTGMGMTEKQGGSDVRANTTCAEPLGIRVPGQPYQYYWTQVVFFRTHVRCVSCAGKNRRWDPVEAEPVARRLAFSLVVAMQASLLVRHAPTAVADAFCESRIDGNWRGAFGTLSGGIDFDAIISRAAPGL